MDFGLISFTCICRTVSWGQALHIGPSVLGMWGRQAFKSLAGNRFIWMWKSGLLSRFFSLLFRDRHYHPCSPSLCHWRAGSQALSDTWHMEGSTDGNQVAAQSPRWKAGCWDNRTCVWLREGPGELCGHQCSACLWEEVRGCKDVLKGCSAFQGTTRKRKVRAMQLLIALCAMEDAPLGPPGSGDSKSGLSKSWALPSPLLTALSWRLQRFIVTIMTRTVVSNTLHVSACVTNSVWAMKILDNENKTD